jgi:hypothetical protein
MTGSDATGTEFWSILSRLDHVSAGYLVLVVIVLVLPGVLSILRMEWFSRKPPKVRRDIIELRRAERRDRELPQIGPRKAE